VATRTPSKFKRLARTVRRQRTILGALMRDVQRRLNRILQGDGSALVAGQQHSASAIAALNTLLGRAERIRTQQRHDKNKLYALHAPEVECIGKGKARKPYEFGVKVSLAITHRLGLMVGARSFAGNPYDGHTLAEQLEQTNNLLQDIGAAPTTAVVDLGFRGVDEACAPVQLIHRGKFKSLDKQQRKWLKRRQAIEPAIGHTKSDHRMDRCWLKDADGDALHALLCAAGFNIRWLLRAIAAKGLKGLLLAFSKWALWLRWLASALPIASAARTAPTSMLASRTHHALAMSCSA
jgi:transposase, IS5 family